MSWIIETEENLCFLSNEKKSFPVQWKDLEILRCTENIGEFQTEIYNIMHSSDLRMQLKKTFEKDGRSIDNQLRELQNAVRNLFDREI